MCKYCDKPTNLISTSKSSDAYSNEQNYLDVELNNGELIANADLYDEESLYGQISINYCPFCGKKIKKQKQLKLYYLEDITNKENKVWLANLSYNSRVIDFEVNRYVTLPKSLPEDFYNMVMETLKNTLTTKAFKKSKYQDIDSYVKANTEFLVNEFRFE